MQDIVFLIGNLLFAIALIPSVLGPHKPDVKTSLLTGSTLAVYAITFVTLNLYWSALGSTITSTIWLILAYQKSAINKTKL